ncbi:MAG: 2-phospho-L-lactate guanylyltransferase [Gammaproteobacteria bacterium]|nr:2-phospho-L-lactate guanylyltransferase [Gammaproteobacteria bacterium]
MGSSQKTVGLWAVLPVKPFSEGKSRLAHVLTPTERKHLNKKLFRHTLEAILASTVETTIVVSSSEEVRRLAAQMGAMPLVENAGNGDLNAALNQGADHARDAGAHALVSLSADLPWVSSEDIDALVDTQATMSVAIAPDRHDVGTNAIFQRPIGVIEFCYGTDSFAKHRSKISSTLKGKIAIRIVRREGLCFDVDTQTDLEELRSAEGMNEGYSNATCPSG